MVDVIVPLPDQLSEQFWSGARRGELVIQRCQKCRVYNHPPQVVCNTCSSSDFAYPAVEGRGRVHSYTSSLRRRGATEGDGGQSHINIIVELDIQPGIFLVGRVAKDESGWVEIGVPVAVWFEQVDNTDLVLPQFRPV